MLPLSAAAVTLHDLSVASIGIPASEFSFNGLANCGDKEMLMLFLPPSKFLWLKAREINNRKSTF